MCSELLAAAEEAACTYSPAQHHWWLKSRLHSPTALGIGQWVLNGKGFQKAIGWHLSVWILCAFSFSN